MKTLFTVLLAFICLNSFAQKVQLPLNADSLIEYQQVIKLDSAYNYQTLYKTAKKWFVHNFNSAKSVIQSEDQINGIFLAKASIEIHQTGLSLAQNPIADFTIQIDIKQGKYRYKFNSFILNQMVFNTNTTIDLNDFYTKYKRDKLYKPAFQSKKSFDKRTSALLIDFDNQMNILINNLNAEMKNAKTDDF